MESKITSRTRIKLYWYKLWLCKKQIDIPNNIKFPEFFLEFQNETGLTQTSIHFDYKVNEQVHYFKIVDKQKFSLAKLKYQI